MVWTSSKKVKFDLEGQGQLPQKTIGILTKVFCFSGPNLVILAWTVDELLLGQAHDWRTHRRRQRQYPATTIPEGQNWPRVKTLTGSSLWQILVATVSSNGITPTYLVPSHCLNQYWQLNFIEDPNHVRFFENLGPVTNTKWLLTKSF